MMAAKNQFNIHTTYYESFFALSVSIRKDKLHQLKLETHRVQAPVLRYRDITFTSEFLKESLSAECLLVGVHNVGRVRHGAQLLMIEVDFTEEKPLERFCKSMSSGEVQKRLQERLEKSLYGSNRDIDVSLKLHLILPNAEKKSPVSQEVTTDNYHECFSVIRESALFEFGALSIAQDAFLGGSTQPDLSLGIDDLHELLKPMLEVAADWLTIGVFLKIEYSALEIIKKDYRDQSKDCLREMLAFWLNSGNASPGVLVQALKSFGMVVLAKKIAVKHGITTVVATESNSVEPDRSSISTVKDLIESLQLARKSSHNQDSIVSLQLKMMPMLSSLDDIRKRIAADDKQHLLVSESFDDLKKKEREMTETLENVKSSFGSVKLQVDKLKQEQKSLIEKRERKTLSKRWLLKQQKASSSAEDLVELDQVIKDTEEAVVELNKKINQLEEMIVDHNKQAKQMKAELNLKEKERQQLNLRIDEIQKEKELLACKLEEDRKTFANRIQEMIHMNDPRLSETKVKPMNDNLSHRKKLEMAQATASPWPTTSTLDQKPPEPSIEKEEWYFGIIDRKEAKSKCRSTGDYLVRYSARKNKYVLSVHWNGAGTNFVIQEVPDPARPGCSLYQFEGERFCTIRDLLNYHVKSQIPITKSSGVILNKFVSHKNKWAIKRNEVLFLNEKLGHGAMSEVFMAKSITLKRKVAIKTCRSSISESEKHKFLQEANRLKLYEHPNIIRLIGVIADCDPVYIVMEIMPGGSFLKVLQKRGTSYPKRKLTLMCTDICAGMAYLEENNCIHRDLAARNCLVGENDIVKISNFWMSQKEEGGIYIASGSHQIPNCIKWTAPEALNLGKYTSASDVWSFGILLWETFSFGSVPYPGMNNQETSDQVKAGYRMPPPSACPEAVYEVMLKCWQYDEEERPMFKELHPMLTSVCQQIKN